MWLSLWSGPEAIEENDASLVRDAELIGAAQRVEHYEIAAYGTVKALALLLGESEVAALLDATLKDEGAADKKLTVVSVEVNGAALEEGGED